MAFGGLAAIIDHVPNDIDSFLIDQQLIMFTLHINVYQSHFTSRGGLM